MWTVCKKASLKMLVAMLLTLCWSSTSLLYVCCATARSISSNGLYLDNLEHIRTSRFKRHRFRVPEYIDSKQIVVVKRSLLGLVSVYNMLQTEIVEATTVKSFQQLLRDMQKTVRAGRIRIGILYILRATRCTFIWLDSFLFNIQHIMYRFVYLYSIAVYSARCCVT